MASIKGHNNSTIAWTDCEVDSNLICTRSFAKLNKTAHYDFCKAFFENGEEQALKVKEYCQINLKSHEDLFNNLPKDLDQQPIWWLMPWGGTIRNPEFNKEARIEFKKHYTTRFLNLLKSIEKNGFVVNKNFRPPVHQLIKGKKTVYILQDGHHRSAIFNYIISQGRQNLLRIEENACPNKIMVKNELVIRYSYLPHLKYVKIENNRGHFSLGDTFKWFDLAFNVLGLNTKASNSTLDYRLAILQDKLYKKKHD